MKWQQLSTFQGRGWKARQAHLRQEMDGQTWSASTVNSEWNELREVLLYLPGPELKQVRDPQQAQHLRLLDVERLRREMLGLARAYRDEGITVHWLNRRLLPTQFGPPPPNLMFVRDLFFNSLEGCVLARMASSVRAPEEKFASVALSALGLPLRPITGGALFEGPDALWLNPQTVLCGIGNRTNREGFEQLRAFLALQKVRCLPVAMPKGVQHLLGILQVVDQDCVVLRHEKASPALRKLLAGFEVIEVPESVEVLQRQGLNFVTIRPREIIMAKHCPELKAHLQNYALRVVRQVEISQLCAAAGGLACASGIVRRKLCT